MYDVEGRLVNAIALHNNQTVVNIGNLNPGWYTVVIADANNISLAKAKIGVVR
jgi:hypothetical protein